MSISYTSFQPNTLIKSAEVNANNAAIVAAIPWDSNPVTAKGDILAATASGVMAKVVVGADGKALLADSGAAGGVSWGTLSEGAGGTNQTTYTEGDLLYSSATDTLSKLGIGTANQVLKVVNGIPAWSTFAGGINYLAANPDAEADTSGWAAYADTAANTPTDGTGGSPNTTWTRSTSSPLRGSASFLLTKSGSASRQGEGVSYAFTIDTADKAKPLAITFDYIIGSGTFTASDGITAPLNDGTTSTTTGNSDLEVFVYDVTNAQLISVTPEVLLSASSTTPGSFKGTFQTSPNSTSYRLIIHTATTTTNDFTVKFDNFYVGPQAVNYGATVGDWEAFTPTGSWSTNTAYSGYRRRVGDTEDYVVKIILSGAPDAATTLYINVPSDRAVDTTKALYGGVETDFVGYGGAFRNGVVNLRVGVGLITSATQLELRYLLTPTGSNPQTVVDGGSVATTAPVTWGTSDNITVRFSLPILGWSSNAIMSNDTDTRVVAAVYTSTSGQTLTSGDRVNFENKIIDTHGAVTTGAGAWEFTAPVSGIYRVSGNLQGGSTVTSLMNVNILHNGSGTKIISNLTGSTTNFTAVSWSGLLSCTAGDTIYATLNNNTGNAINTDGTQINIEKVSNPAAIAASESVTCRYSITSGTALTGSDTIIDFDTKSYDSHGAVTTGASWKFTAPISGKYRVTCRTESSAGLAFSVDGQFNLLLYKNGSSVSTISAFRSQASATFVGVANGSDTISLLAGDYIDIRGNTSVNCTTATGSLSFLTVERVGN